MYHRIGKDGRRYWGTKGAGILFTDGKKILLLKRAEKGDNHGTWCFPGGRADDGETAIDTAVREAEEECGGFKGSRIAKFEERDGQHQWTTFIYKVDRPFKCYLSDEHSDWKWVPINDIFEYQLHPKVGQNMETYLDKIREKFGSISFKEYFHREVRPQK